MKSKSLKSMMLVCFNNFLNKVLVNEITNRALHHNVIYVSKEFYGTTF